MRASDRFPTLIEEGKKTSAAPSYAVTRCEHFMRDRIAPLFEQKFAMSRLSKNCGSCSHFELYVL
jgi:hypothetical protein